MAANSSKRMGALLAAYDEQQQNRFTEIEASIRDVQSRTASLETDQKEIKQRLEEVSQA